MELDTEDIGSNTSRNDTFGDVMRRRFSRRSVLRTTAAATPVVVLGLVGVSCTQDTSSTSTNNTTQAPSNKTALGFQPIQPNTDDKVTVPAGYTAQTLIRFGDPMFPGMQPFSLQNLTPEYMARAWGSDPDMIYYFPVPNQPNRGLLAVNFENLIPGLMFTTYDPQAPTKQQVDVEMAAHGVGILEIERQSNGEWRTILDSAYNRRITAETEMLITGPAAGHELMKTSYDPSGTRVRGTLNNCAGGWTQWDTYLTAEENFNGYFSNLNGMDDADARKAQLRRYGLTTGASTLRWESHYPRFDLTKEPNESHRFGWVVEIDPFDPKSTPKKRTALGRMKHENAMSALAADNRVVIYTGDDERFDYTYKFITTGRYTAGNKTANADLLDSGTLYVAKFNDDGTGQWLPLTFGQNGLTADAGFSSQADVLINVRLAADKLGATKMDRTEDIERNPVNGKIYAAYTNNTNRTAAQVDKMNPRAENKHGHIIEFSEEGNDPGALRFRWEIFLLAGDPAVEADGTYFAGFDKTKVSPISCVDNVTFDASGNLWISTDGAPATIKTNDGLFVAPVDGPERGFVRQFVSVPRGAELCGPIFTPDHQTLFINVQHPGEGGTLDKPVSQWPDNTNVPRGATVAITKASEGSKVIGA